MPQSLSCRLRLAGIVAGMYAKPTRRNSAVNSCDVLVGFRLHERAEDATTANPEDRVPGACLNTQLGVIGLPAWEEECERAHRAVCDHFNIKETTTHVNQETGQLVFQVFRAEGDRQRVETCRWMIGLGWIGW